MHSVRFVGGGRGVGEFNPVPTLVTENFCLGVGFDPSSVPIQQDQHNVQMISKYCYRVNLLTSGIADYLMNTKTVIESFARLS